MPSKIAPEDLTIDDAPTSINPYKVLSLEELATPDQIKTAYRKAALRHHPDKASPSDRDAAHTKFQEIAFAYAILSDERRRKRYDTTGRTEESMDLEDDTFDWTSYYREQFANVITGDVIEKFTSEYKDSAEERQAILAAYEKYEGDMDGVYEEVMASDPVDDDARFRSIINDAIEEGEVESFKNFTKESKRSIEARIKKARSEGGEAEEHARELGVHDKLFGKKKGGKKGGGEDALAALIQQRQKGRQETFLDNLEAKYAGKSGKSKKRKEVDEPSEEMFERNAKKGKARKSKN